MFRKNKIKYSAVSIEHDSLRVLVLQELYYDLPDVLNHRVMVKAFQA